MVLILKQGLSFVSVGLFVSPAALTILVRGKKQDTFHGGAQDVIDMDTLENDAFRKGIGDAMAKRHSIVSVSSDSPGFDCQIEEDKLAALLRLHLDIPRLKALGHLI